jgi:cytoskeleton protein RodZ
MRPRAAADRVYNPAFMFDIGSSLREARLRQELDFPELEERTKIRPKYLRALEDERFDILPAPTYVRGFLRSYAEALGLDGQPFVDEYNSRFTVGEDDAPLRARRVPQPRRDRGPRESRIAAVALVAIAVATALVIAAWKFGGPEGEKVPGLASSPNSGLASNAHGTAHLAVRASEGSSWMEVRTATSSGKLLYSGTLEQGQRKSFDGKSLQVALAKPQNVVVRLNGNRVELPRGTTFVVTSRRIVRAPS